MPRRNDIQRIMILGSGPIKIGQAAEFDFSGSLACRALRADGYEVILVNSNPATIQNDPEMADQIYIEPLLRDVVRMILEIERPDALLAGMGGQTALNLASTLSHDGSLAKFGVELIGCDLVSIDEAEDRELFNQVCQEVNLPICEANACNSINEVLEAAEKIGKYPLLVRPAFTLGGLGGGTGMEDPLYLQVSTGTVDVEVQNTGSGAGTLTLVTEGGTLAGMFPVPDSPEIAFLGGTPLELAPGETGSLQFQVTGTATCEMVDVDGALSFIMGSGAPDEASIMDCIGGLDDILGGGLPF